MQNVLHFPGFLAPEVLAAGGVTAVTGATKVVMFMICAIVSTDAKGCGWVLV